MQLENTRMHDGSRLFATLPECEPWGTLSEHVVTLKGATITSFLTDNVTEVWIDFEFADHRFSINNQFGEYYFFVDDPSCKDEVLNRVAEHCSRLLKR